MLIVDDYSWFDDSWNNQTDTFNQKILINFEFKGLADGFFHTDLSWSLD